MHIADRIQHTINELTELKRAVDKGHIWEGEAVRQTEEILAEAQEKLGEPR